MYSPAGFGRQWSARAGVDIFDLPDDEATRVLGSVVAGALVQAVALAIVINSLDASTISEGLGAGAVLWLGLTGATTVGDSF